MPLLTAVPAYLGDGHAIDTDFLESFLDVLDFVRLDDRFNLFHIGLLRYAPLVYASKLYPSSPCMLRSRPSISACSLARTPVTASHTLRMIQVPTIASPAAIRTPIKLLMTCPGLPSTRPMGLPARRSLTSFVAKTPVRIAPTVP